MTSHFNKKIGTEVKMITMMKCQPSRFQLVDSDMKIGYDIVRVSHSGNIWFHSQCIGYGFFFFFFLKDNRTNMQFNISLSAWYQVMQCLCLLLRFYPTQDFSRLYSKTSMFDCLTISISHKFKLLNPNFLRKH